MAASAVIGALRVNLGLDSASFEKGLKQSQANLAKFGKVVAVGFAAATTAAVAAGTAMGVAVKGAIDNADAMSKAAQKIGVTTEALSRLKYAADYSDVSLEQLTTGLGRLSKTMLDVSTGSKGPAATAFKALGIAVTDAAGNLRNSDLVFADIADRFSRMEDGATKTALAISLFGRAGAEMIPLLNSGKDGLAAMAVESDKLGLTLSTSTGKAAEQFNDTITKVGKIMDGVVNKVMAAALPALQSLAETLASPQFAEAAATLASTLVAAFDVVVQAVAGTTNAIKGFLDWLNGMDGGAVAGGNAIDGMMPDQKNKLWSDLSTARSESGVGMFNPDLYAGFNFGSDGKIKVERPSPTKAFAPVIDGAATAKTAMVDLMAGIEDAQPKVENFAKSIGDSLAGAFSRFADSALSGVPAVEALSDVLGDLGKQLLNSAISNFFGNLFGGGFGGGFSLPGRMPGTANLLNAGMFADGGITNQPAIFGESGPEAAVPLPDGRSIPVTFTNGGGAGGATEVLIRLDQNLIAQIVKQNSENAVRIVKTQAPAAVMAYQRNGGA